MDKQTKDKVPKKKIVVDSVENNTRRVGVAVTQTSYYCGSKMGWVAIATNSVLVVHYLITFTIVLGGIALKRLFT
jgi:hypothetical protein